MASGSSGVFNEVHIVARVVEATKNNIFFVADRDYWVKSVDVVKSADSAGVTMDLEVLDDGVAAGSGTDIVASAVDLGTTPDNRTRLSQTLTATLANRKISAGQMIGTQSLGTVVGEVAFTIVLAVSPDAANVG